MSMDLADLLDRHRDELVEAWVELKRQLPHPRYQGQPPSQLRATTARQLSAVIEMVSIGAHTLADSSFAGICHIYQQADLAITIDACLLLKEAAIPLIRREFPSDPDAAWVAVAQLDTCLRWIVGQHIRAHEVEIDRRFQDQQARAANRVALDRVDTISFMANGSEAAQTNGRNNLSLRALAALEERERLARELHDNLAQTLGILKMRLMLADELLVGAQVDHLHSSLREMKEIAAEAYTDAREAIFSLRAPIESGTGFLPSLARYLARYRASYGVDAVLVATDGIVDPLTGEKATQITRIIQEALTNIRKHARANRAWVRMMPEHYGLSIIIEDDGEGFDPVPSLLDSSYGFGLRVMRERAESVGGRLDIDAQMGRGTRIMLWVPLVEKEDKVEKEDEHATSHLIGG